MAFSVEREVELAAAPDVVFEFFTDPEKLVLWMGTAAILEPRQGGLFRLRYSETDVASGAFVEVDRPRRLVFTWGWEQPDGKPRPGNSVVEVTLEPRGPGTLLRLVHRDLSVDEADMHGQGWDLYLAALSKVIS